MAMSIDQFIESYIDFGAYDGLFTEEQVVLLKLAYAGSVRNSVCRGRVKKLSSMRS